MNIGELTCVRDQAAVAYQRAVADVLRLKAELAAAEIKRQSAGAEYDKADIALMWEVEHAEIEST